MCNIQETGKSTRARGINYEHAHPSLFCSLELSMSTKLIGDQPASRTVRLWQPWQHMANIYLPAFALSFYHHLGPRHVESFERTISLKKTQQGHWKWSQGEAVWRHRNAIKAPSVLQNGWFNREREREKMLWFVKILLTLNATFICQRSRLLLGQNCTRELKLTLFFFFPPSLDWFRLMVRRLVLHILSLSVDQ